MAGGVGIGTATVRHGVVLVGIDTSTLAVGRQSLVLAYGGDDRYAASTGSVQLTVLRARR